VRDDKKERSSSSGDTNPAILYVLRVIFLKLLLEFFVGRSILVPVICVDCSRNKRNAIDKDMYRDAEPGFGSHGWSVSLSFISCLLM